MRVNLKVPESKKLKQDTIIKTLMNADSAQINKWVDDNIKEIDDVKSILSKLISLNMYLLKNNE